MTEFYINPKYILVDFLRKNLTDPRTSRTSNIETHTHTISSNTYNIDFDTFTHKFSFINKITKNGTELNKWKDYLILFREKKISFKQELIASDEIIIEYGTAEDNWIFWDNPIPKLSSEKYPRISISTTSSVGERLGRYDTPIFSNIQFEVSIWGKEQEVNQIFEIDGHNYKGQEILERIGYDISKIFNEKELEFNEILFDCDPIQNFPRENMFDETLQAFKKVLEFGFNSINLGFYQGN